jgi:gamma-glutamylcyclotransferase (GGCT)/AIG2-like uncharacterized protein YtfP
MQPAAPSGGGGGTAFVYGTLMADEVVRLLLKRVPASQPATLAGYRRHAIKAQVFPAIVPAEASASVRGKVLLQLTKKELEILDGEAAFASIRAAPAPAIPKPPLTRRQQHRPSPQFPPPPPPPNPPPPVYEAEEYYRASVQPVLDDGSALEADVYVWKDHYRWVGGCGVGGCGVG